MDKRLFDKSSNFFKKEGFYVILFLCLCVVASAAAITSRNRKAVQNKPPVAQKDNITGNKDLASGNTEEPGKQVDNALQVKNNTPSVDVSVPKNGSASTAVSTTVNTTFSKPVEGTVVREFTTAPDVFCSVLGSYKWNVGLDIKADLGKPVVAALDGKVDAVANDGNRDLGQYVVVNHQNGLKTVYANLDKTVSVKVGDTVKKGVTVLGKIGETRENYADDKIGSYLHFQVKKNNEYVNPATYVKYTAAKTQ